jgi:uncharacterized metal-binding protein YceD (DUF177 family)
MTLSAAPLTHTIPVTSLPADGREVAVTATPGECAAIAENFGLVACNSLKAVITLGRAGGPLITVQGHIDAEVVQECCVTLEPVTNQVDADFALTFTLDPERSQSEVEIDVDDADPPEAVENGEIDVGALACEHLALNLDPYPRKPGAAFATASSGDGDDLPPAVNSPFAVLSGLNNGKNGG